MAHARVAHRLYSQGLITDEDWESKIREPMHFGGLINLRPYLDPRWQEGSASGFLAIGVGDTVVLPAMPVSSKRDDRRLFEPSFEDLLSKQRFFFRCQLAKQQGERTVKHPLIVEFSEVIHEFMAQRYKAFAARWRNSSKSSSNLALVPEVNWPVTFSNTSSTLGSVSNFHLKTPH